MIDVFRFLFVFLQKINKTIMSIWMTFQAKTTHNCFYFYFFVKHKTKISYEWNHCHSLSDNFCFVSHHSVDSNKTHRPSSRADSFYGNSVRCFAKGINIISEYLYFLRQKCNDNEEAIRRMKNIRFLAKWQQNHLNSCELSCIDG